LKEKFGYLGVKFESLRVEAGSWREKFLSLSLELDSLREEFLSFRVKSKSLSLEFDSLREQFLSLRAGLESDDPMTKIWTKNSIQYRRTGKI
jgi:hypothetical protein